MDLGENCKPIIWYCMKCYLFNTLNKLILLGQHRRGNAGIASSRKDWAKIRVTMKQERTQEGEEIQKSRAGPKD